MIKLVSIIVLMTFFTAIFSQPYSMFLLTAENLREDDALRERVKKMIVDIGGEIEYVDVFISEVEKTGVDIHVYRDFLKTAIDVYNEAIKLYEEGVYGEAFSKLIYVKTRIQLIVKTLEKFTGERKPMLELLPEDVHERLAVLEGRLRELEEVVRETAGVDESVWNRINQIKNLLDKVRELSYGKPELAFKILDKVENLLDQVFEEIYREETTTTTILRKPTETLQKGFSREYVETEVLSKKNMSISLRESEEGYNIVVEYIERRIEFENGTVLVIRENIVTRGGKTTISISKELIVSGNKSIDIGNMSLEKDQSLVGALFKISLDKPQIIRVDPDIETEIINVEKNSIAIKLRAPEGFTGRLFVIDLYPDVIDLENLAGLNVTINNQEAIMATSIIDLAMEIYDQPAYVFVVSARGVQILLYIPHFSEYTVYVNAILQNIGQAIQKLLQQIINMETMFTATITTTIIIILSTILIMREKKRIQKII
ncbi:MAG: hypothetical protein QW655_00220 [Nitrososphaerota archaeon]|nr:hypothetical protein [Candidatus Geocrenenecus dongiae]